MPVKFLSDEHIVKYGGSPGRRRHRSMERGRLISMNTTKRAIAWVKQEPFGAEFADVVLSSRRLTAVGIAIGGEPVPYRLDYTRETGSGFVSLRLLRRTGREGGVR